MVLLDDYRYMYPSRPPRTVSLKPILRVLAACLIATGSSASVPPPPLAGATARLRPTAADASPRLLNASFPDAPPEGAATAGDGSTVAPAVIRRDELMSPSSSHGYRIVSDEVVYSRWRSMIRRVVRMPSGLVVDYDIVDQKGAGAVIIFAWDSRSKTATIVREYNPGCHRVLGGLAAGIIETCPSKHGSDPLIAARHELEEECHLAGGTWHRLTEEGISIPMDKYAVTEVTAYLVVDPTRVDDPKPLDAEEDIEIVRGVSVDDVLRMVKEGDMNLVGGWASLLAIEKLRELGEIS